MTFEELMVKLNGEYIEVAGSANAKNQCVDLANYYIREVLGKPIIEWTNAVDFPARVNKNDYEWIANTPTNAPMYGDIIVFGGKVGHIAIVISSTVKTVTSFDQNFPTGTPCHVQSHSYSNVLGWLRLKKSAVIAQTIAQVLTDQSKYDFGGDIGVQELGAIRSIVNDTRRDLKSTQNELRAANMKIAELLDKQEQSSIPSVPINQVSDSLWDAIRRFFGR